MSETSLEIYLEIVFLYLYLRLSSYTIFSSISRFYKYFFPISRYKKIVGLKLIERCKFSSISPKVPFRPYFEINYWHFVCLLIILGKVGLG